MLYRLSIFVLIIKKFGA